MKKRLKRTIAIFTVFTLFSIFREGEGGEALKFLPELKTVTTLAATAPSVSYSTHIQSYGWQKDVKDGKPSGTIGEAKRLEGIKINLPDSKYSGSVEYRTHVEKYGWMGWKSTGNMSGTTGESKRLEAIEIRLTGELAKQYDIYYRVHAQKFGWLDWAKNGESAGTAGYAYRLEAIEIKLVKKGEKGPSAGGAAFKEYVKVPSVQYQTHVQSIGWQGYKRDGQVSGTFGQAKRLEGIRLKLSNLPYSGGMRYRTHVQSKGWMSWQSNNALSGTTGEAKRLEAIEVELTGEMAKHYDVYYRVHAQTFGWLGWAKNGEPAGSEGYAKRLEGIEVRLVKKGNAAPGNTSNAFKNKNIKVEKKTVQVKEKEVAYKVTEELSPDLLKGEKEIKQKGQNGFDAVSYEVTYTNGKETNRKELSRKTTKPVNAVVEVGTKPITTVKRVNQTTTLNPGVSYIENKDLEKGIERVKTEGVAGKSVQAFDVTLDANGVEISRVAVGAPVVTPAVNKVVEVGTKTIVTKKIVKRTTEDTKAIEVVQELTDTMRLGEEKVKSNGSKAVIETSYELVYEDGVLVSETVVAGSQKVIKAATPKVILVGTMRYLNAYENPEQDLKVGDTFNDAVIQRFIINETRTFDELKALSASERYSNANNNDLQNIVQTKVENGTHWSYWNLPIKLGTMTVNNFNSESMIDMGLYNQHFLKLVNEKRTAAGLSALSTSATLKAGSDLRAQEQADYGDIRSNGVAHQRPNGTRYDTAFSDDVRSQFAIGENIGAFTYNGNPNRVVSEQYLAEYAFNQLWGSEQHRNNMMNQYFTHQYVSIRMNKTYKNNNTFTYFTYTQILGIQK